MQKFKVNGDISEPTAYAVCALQEYGFDPEEDNKVFYSVFDFGGGTTDFPPLLLLYFPRLGAAVR